MSKHFEIYPVHCGTVPGVQYANQTLQTHVGETLDLPSFLWVVQSSGRTVIVDSGPGEREVVQELTGKHLRLAQSPQQRLHRLGVDPNAVQDVVLTHLHYDHVGGISMFPNARVHVQRSELQWAISPLPVHRGNYEWGRGGHTPRWLQEVPRMVTHQGDAELDEGIRLIHLPGHSPGSMGVLVDTEAGQYLIAGDTVPLQENIDAMVPSGWYVDLEIAYASLHRARNVADHILPSHDPAMVAATRFPSPLPDSPRSVGQPD